MKKFRLTASALLAALLVAGVPHADAVSFQLLGTLPGDGYSIPYGSISGDGTTVVGYSRTSEYSGSNHAWKWTRHHGHHPDPRHPGC